MKGAVAIAIAGEREPPWMSFRVWPGWLGPHSQGVGSCHGGETTGFGIELMLLQGST